MSGDSSRDAVKRADGPGKKSGESSLRIAYQPTLAADDVRKSASTLFPTSGRPNVAQLPVVDQDTYHIEGEVGQGGIGRVLSARDKRLDRRVAVKILREEGGTYEDRFVREALVTARLQHPSIVPVYEAGRWPSGEPFYSMKLVSGQPLLEIIHQARTLDERLPLLTRVLAVADAVAYAHEKRIIHRDLKPANVLIGAHGETMLIDWGLAKDLNDPGASSAEPEEAIDPNAPVPGHGLTMMGSVMGTPAYMPPEQAAGEPVDERADVYALGALLYHVLSGKQPFEGLDGLQILMRVLNEPPAALPTLQSGIPRDLLTIVDKAMARDKAARYPTAKEFAEDLRRFLAGQLVGAHHYSARERFVRFVRKNRAALAVGATAFVLMAINGAFNMSRIVRERDRAEAERQNAENAREKALVAERDAIERADELTLVEARAAVERDPNDALAWLKVLSPSFRKWNAARFIAADAWSRGPSTIVGAHKEIINMMAWSPDERFLLTASDDRTARIFDLGNGSEKVLLGHTDEVWSTGISPDGQRVATGGKDATIRIWDVASGKMTGMLEGHTGGVVYTIFSRDGKSLFSQSDDFTLRVWDLASGTNRILASGQNVSLKSSIANDQRHFVTGGVDGSVWFVGLDDAAPKRLNALSVNTAVGQVVGEYPFAISPHGRYVAAGGSDGLLRLWDLEAEKLRVLDGQVKPIVRLSFSPDGRQIATASFDGALRLWDLEAGTFRALPSQEANVLTIKFSPDGRVLATGGYDRSLRVIDLSTGQRRRFVGMRDSVTQALFSKDGQRLVASSGDGSVRMFRLDSGVGRTLGQHSSPAFSLDVSSRGDRVVTAGKDGLVQIWPVLGNTQPISLVGHVGPVYAVRFSPNGELIASLGADSTVRLWDSTGHQIRGMLLDGTFPWTNVEFSSPGSMLAVGDASGVVYTWNVDSGEVRVLGRHEAPVLRIAFSPDGRLVGSAGAEQTAYIWDVETGTVVKPLRGHDRPVSWLAFAPDGQTIATGSNDHRLRIWDPGASKPRVYDASGYTFLGMNFLPDGQSLLTINGETVVRWWDVATGKVRKQYRGHRGVITTLALSRDGASFVTGSSDRTVRLHDLDTGESRVLGVHEGIVHAVGMDPQGQWAVSVGDDGAVRLWPDDLPRDPEALRAWITQSVADEIDVNRMGEGGIPLP